jgi:hypothetical protein
MTFQFLTPAGRQIETASAIALTFFLSFVFHSFNFICALSMSSNDAEFVEQPDGALLRTPCRVFRNGRAVRVRSHAQILDIVPALVSEEKIKKGRVAPAPYQHLKYSTAQLDAEYRKYYQY